MANTQNIAHRTAYAACPVCGSRQVILAGLISAHQAKSGGRWATCSGSGQAAS